MGTGLGMIIRADSRLEFLADELSELLSVGRSVFRTETVVIPSLGTARWLSGRVAERLGVCANIAFKLPKTFILEDVCGLSPADSACFSRDVMSWRISARLPMLIAGSPELFAAASRYVGLESSPDWSVRLHALSNRLAGVFDQYMTFRPNMILEWSRLFEDSEDMALDRRADKSRESAHWEWQKALWLEVMRDAPTHPPQLFNDFIRNGMDLARAEQLRRVFLFGFSTMPPVHLSVFNALAGCVEVRFFYLNPCREYWADIISKKEILRRSEGDPEAWENNLRAEAGNELLASFGRAGREFLAELLSQDADIGGDAEKEEDAPENETMLATLQRGVLGFIPASEISRVAAPGDDSIRVHSCHNRMREVEVLRDELLRLFDKGGIQPSDIVVMAPDMGAYEPFVEAVFGVRRAGEPCIAYNVADRTLGGEFPEALAYLGLLGIPRSRFKASDVMGPLDCAAVRRRFDMDDDAMDWLRRKLGEAGAAWGWDAAHRGSLGVPAFEENSWRLALDRLLLGYAMGSASSPDELYKPSAGSSAAMSPVGRAEGGRAEVLGRFVDYASKLESLRHKLDKPRLAKDWRLPLMGMLDDFFLTTPQSKDGVIALRQAVDGLCSTMDAALGEDEFEIHFDAVKAEVERRVAGDGSGSGFLQGGVTFCRMQPLRNVPAKVVCLLGMNGGEFPRTSKAGGFDLMAECRRFCDRSPRDEDRQLFLEAVLSARSCLRVFYVGQSDKDNTEIPPSTVVDELLDHVKAVFGAGAPGQVRFKHPLHPFSPKYFSAKARNAWKPKLGDDWNLGVYSYSSAWFAAAQALVSASRDCPAPWAAARQSNITDEEAGRESDSLTLEELIDFLTNPSKFHLQSAGIRMDIYKEEALPDDESIDADNLEKYKLRDALSGLEGVEKFAGNDDVRRGLCSFARAGGQLPVGPAGGLLFEESARQASALAVAVLGGCGGKIEPRRVSIVLDDAGGFPDCLPLPPPQHGARLSGKLSHLREKAAAWHRPGNRKGKDDIQAWVRHLALSADTSGCAVATRLFFLKSKEVEESMFAPLPQAEAKRILTFLAALRRVGVSRPLPFFQGSSKAYAVEHLKADQADTGKKAISKADAAWVGGYDEKGDGNDVSVRFCFGEEPPSSFPEKLKQEFHGLSLAVFGPMLAAQAEPPEAVGVKKPSAKKGGAK